MPLDKILHALGGAVIAALLVGSLKEWVWDAWMKRGNFEPMDLLATVAGAVAFVGVYSGVRLWI